MKTAVVILNYNNWKDTIQCLDSISKCDGDFCCIVLEHGSHDESRSKLEAYFEALPDHQIMSLPISNHDEPVALAKWSLVNSDENHGPAWGNNRGLELALKDQSVSHFWVLNNDTEVDPKAIIALRARCAEDDAIGMCGSRLMWHHLPTKLQAAGGARYNWAHATSRNILDESLSDAEVEQQMDLVHGASVMVTRPFVETIGLMNEEYFLYFEEVDWAVRSGGRFKMAYASDSIVYHKEGGTIGSDSLNRPSDLSLSYIARNRFIFTRNHAPNFVWALRKRFLFECFVHFRRLDFKALNILCKVFLKDLFAHWRPGLDVRVRTKRNSKQDRAGTS